MATKDLEMADAQSPAVDESKTDSSSTSKKRKTEITEIEVDLNQPEPPSKKARRLLKKGKALPTKPQSGDENDDDEKATTTTSDGANKDGKKKERSPYGIWIGNLRFSVTKNDLRKWFVENSGGAITDELITRVNLPTTKPVSGGGPGPKKAAENRGFAYVDFATFEANVAAIALSETEWNGRKVLIKDSKSYEGRPKKEETTADGEAKTENGNKTGAATSGEKKKNPSTKIFVGNLSFTTTEDDLQAHFEKCGKIRWVKVATFEDTGKCKGYGWVNFEEPEAAEWAVKGFVKVRETIDVLEDFLEKEEEEEEGGDDTEKKDENNKADEENDNGDKSTPTKAKVKKEKEAPRIKTRKWWVNQLLGRNLKIELAEDDQLRYAKRFKKGGQKNKEGGGGNPRQQQQNGEDRGGSGGSGGSREKKDVPVREKKPAYADDIAVARLTGAAVAPQGKKTTFD